ncbi:hypothetical protein CJ184_007410 [Actinotignum urinale]|uniref:hypothetical protein n=1 Tax=Actinotignum urinale TaxID=190146 RepID=UPI000C807D6B|nr:hypothetical protein [Actinotignum urinale]WIK59046.1 hypothetical protein CJ184_007410 [Actinotignum urinale]
MKNTNISARKPPQVTPANLARNAGMPWEDIDQKIANLPNKDTSEQLDELGTLLDELHKHLGKAQL